MVTYKFSLHKSDHVLTGLNLFRIECELLTMHYKVLHSLALPWPRFTLLSPTGPFFCSGSTPTPSKSLCFYRSFRMTSFLCPHHFSVCHPWGWVQRSPPHECLPQPPWPLPSVICYHIIQLSPHIVLSQCWPLFLFAYCLLSPQERCFHEGRGLASLIYNELPEPGSVPGSCW